MKMKPSIALKQCDQMAFTVFIICPFTTMKNCPIEYKIGNNCCQILN